MTSSIIVYSACHVFMYMYYIQCTCAGALLGFTNLGEVDTHLTRFEQSLKGDKAEGPHLAKTMLVLMVRGLFSSLQFPYAQFPCATLRGDQLFPLFWESVARLERYGVKVLGLTCDGLSANRRFFQLHNGDHKLAYKVHNPYTSEPRMIYFLSDPPHLLKTVRNCWASKNRELWVSV